MISQIPPIHLRFPLVNAMVLLATFLEPTVTWAQGSMSSTVTDVVHDDPERTDSPEERAAVRNPAGSILVQGTAGVASGSGSTRFVLGLGVGYAVFDGVVPGLRGLFIAGDDVGGELAGTLTVTPPFRWAITPFLVGEAGRRWDLGLSGWLLGAGGGVYFGAPDQAFNVQVGWIFRRFLVSDGETYDASGPIVGFILRF